MIEAPPYLPGALDPSDPLFDLQSLAALVFGTPHLSVGVQDAEEADHVLQLVRSHAGADAFAQILEDDTHLWCAARLPGLDLERWLRLSRDLSRHFRHFWLCVPDTINRMDLRFSGHVVGESRDLGALRATTWTDFDGQPLPERRQALQASHPVLVDLFAEIRDLGGASLEPELFSRVRDGRVGVRIPGRLDDGLVHSLVTGRASHHALRLAPEVTEEHGLDPAVILWPITVPAPARPSGDPGPFGVHRPIRTGFRVETLVECAVETLDAGTLERLKHQLGDDFRSEGFTWTSRAGRPCAVQRWIAAEQRDEAMPVAPNIRASPYHLQSLWLQPEPASCIPHRGPHRWFLRCHATLTDHDLAIATSHRIATDRDKELVATLVRALEQVDVQPANGEEETWATPVLSSSRREGLRLSFHPFHHGQEPSYRALLDALDVPDARLDDLATVAFTPARLIVDLWFLDPSDDSEPMTWVRAH